MLFLRGRNANVAGRTVLLKSIRIVNTREGRFEYGWKETRATHLALTGLMPLAQAPARRSNKERKRSPKQDGVKHTGARESGKGGEVGVGG